MISYVRKDKEFGPFLKSGNFEDSNDTAGANHLQHLLNKTQARRKVRNIGGANDFCYMLKPQTRNIGGATG